MADFDNVNRLLPVVNGINDAISALTNSVPVIPARELLAAMGSRFDRERSDTPHDALAILLLPDHVEFLDRRRLYENPISSHAV
ncbi:MAG: hypothetical protein A2V92_00605 [Candidatus Muproteobacteria bacterium RBG_16_65_31]|uniref:Uncharacterized protein n=1 Tax=Candidatus Muproteobacteria bacterium RBG_16_65_31 TaxID=1817759 RepID=A0A1F6TGL5_9PROT|nr:MAG: hypothetical protein A2V92_00605 [Candidatus Muproteobacteria bacterium RBG_16_65_31]